MYSKRVPDYKREEAEEFLRQQRIVFSRSLNPSPEQIRAGFLEHELRTYNRERRLSFLPQITHSDYVLMKHGITVHSYLTKKFDRLSYYKLFAKYNNNLKHG